MSTVSMKFRATTLAVLFAFCSMMMASTGAMAATTAPTTAPHLPTAYVQGTDTLGNALSAVFTVQSFANQGNQLVANGVLNGTITSSTGSVTQVTNQSATLPVTGMTASCPILSLTLGPLNLNILGLQITLNQVVLNIVAIPGNGNLLGNLLCDIANLLNGTNLTGLLDTLVTELNVILSKL
ncbi:MAG TPA: hypothetical protein VKQ11_05005 [Candidatus Sulfotelmatobacter sp.]|nr:hypothetical protein [Candidatus Sulfotelmatobacter sp.]